MHAAAVTASTHGRVAGCHALPRAPANRCAVSNSWALSSLPEQLCDRPSDFRAWLEAEVAKGQVKEASPTGSADAPAGAAAGQAAAAGPAAPAADAVEGSLVEEASMDLQAADALSSGLSATLGDDAADLADGPTSNAGGGRLAADGVRVAPSAVHSSMPAAAGGFGTSAAAAEAAAVAAAAAGTAFGAAVAAVVAAAGAAAAAAAVAPVPGAGSMAVQSDAARTGKRSFPVDLARELLDIIKVSPAPAADPLAVQPALCAAPGLLL